VSTEPQAASTSLRQHAAGPSRVASSDVPRDAHTISEAVQPRARRQASDDCDTPILGDGGLIIEQGPLKGGELNAASPRAVSFLNCPRCGLSIRPKARGSTIEHCPRCSTRASIQVKLFSSPLPTAELYRDGSAPNAEQSRVTPTDRTGSR
jgi:hypothetical protein